MIYLHAASFNWNGESATLNRESSFAYKHMRHIVVDIIDESRERSGELPLYRVGLDKDNAIENFLTNIVNLFNMDAADEDEVTQFLSEEISRRYSNITYK